MTTRPTNPTVIFAGGGSGGHVYPNLAVLERLRDSGLNITPHFLVSNRELDAKLCAKEDVPFTALSAQPMTLHPKRVLPFLNRYRQAVQQAAKLMRQHEAVCVLSSGGFVGGPAITAAKKLGLPSAMMSLDAVPGRANRFSARSAAQVFTAYPTDRLKSAQLIGVPLRKTVLATMTQAKARWDLGLKPERDTLLVFGGSQGGRTINQALCEIVSRERMKRALQDRWQILHITGHDDRESVAQAYAEHHVPGRVEAFCHKMGVAWSAASLAVCRAGAGAVAEAEVNAIPSVFLPYPFHKDQHQRLNAGPLVNRGAALCVADRIDPIRNTAELLGPLTELMLNDDRRETMRQNLLSQQPGDGAQDVAFWIARHLGQGPAAVAKGQIAPTAQAPA